MRESLVVFALFSSAAFTCTLNGNAQSIATFNSVQPAAQTQSLVIPGSHTFQRIIRSGTALGSGGNLGTNLDFTGYVPIDNSSTNGYLSISSETAPAECVILSISLNNANNLWSTTSSGKVSLPIADIGICAAFCSGTVTPKNTIMVCEEVASNGDLNRDGYDDLGWIVEIDPATRAVVNQDGTGGVDKLWAMGRQAHENVAIRNDQLVAYWGGDNITNGFIYKFVPAAAGNFSAGLLYVLETTPALGTGNWKLIANTTKTERNNTIAASVTAGAYNFQRIEDVEIGPGGKVYFASTATGRIYRFTDGGTTVSNLEVYVESGNYDIDGGGPFAAVKFDWPDNLAFDGEGNLWVLQDGGDNHIWVVSPAHTTTAPSIKVFGNTPAGSEPTGITFSPDFKFMFISIQRPNGSNTASQTDAAGDNVVFNANTTLVIARKENLGLSTLPLNSVGLNLSKTSNRVEVNWVTSSVNEHASFEIERSTNAVNFSKIGSVPSSPVNHSRYTYFDDEVPIADNVYYRLHICDSNNRCIYSETKSIKITPLNSLKVFPLSTGNVIRVVYTAKKSTGITMQLYNSSGSEVYRRKKTVTEGINDFNITLESGGKGMYVLKIIDGETIQSQLFIK